METATINRSDLKNAMERLAAQRRHGGKTRVVNAGLLKAGKSTLFNALAGQDVFASDVVRATTQNQEVEQEDYVLLDTPGLDAEEEDTRTALSGYETADILLFVHNVQEGELNQAEMDGIRQIHGLFGGYRDFFKDAILVLTHKDQMEDQYEAIRERIGEQCESILGHRFELCFCVDSHGYQKGAAQQKELLKRESGIPELVEALGRCGKQESGLQRARFEMGKKELLAQMEEALRVLRKSMPEREEASASEAERALDHIRLLSEKGVQEIHKRSVELPGCGSYRSCGQAKNYKEYDSEYSAQTAGKEAISSAIRKAAKMARGNALEIVERAEDYINLAKVPKEMSEALSDCYEGMRRCALNARITIRTNFHVALRDPSEAAKKSGWNPSALKEAGEKLGWARDHARLIDEGSFSGASHYATRYSCNLSIDYDTRDKWVKGMFGGEKCKTVRVYTYDVQGAIDDLAEDAAEKVGDIRSEASEAVREAFPEIKADLERQFRGLTEEILAEVSAQIKPLKEKEHAYRREKEEVESRIADLEASRRAVEAMKW